MKVKSFQIDIFSVLVLLVILSAAFTFYRVYYHRDYYPTFTTDEEIQTMKESEFGFLAQYL